MAYSGRDLRDVLCEQFERVVGKDNHVHFERLVLHLPPDRIRHHCVKAKARVHRYLDCELAVFHGHRCLGWYDANGVIKLSLQKAAA
ncbi:MAG: hypothetical protein FJ194_00875 [Gammaproteobacteria bacterium]|nr:hypothetical protein [Gammaproteobacteria bacterium]